MILSPIRSPIRSPLYSPLAKGGGGISYAPETEALVARFTTPPTTARKGLINDLIVSLKTTGVWSKLDALYLMAAADSQAARRNWIADQYNLTAVAGPIFTTDRGYAGDGSSSYLRTNFNPATAVSPKFIQDSAHVSVADRTSRAAADQVQIGGWVTGVGFVAEIATRYTGDVTLGRINIPNTNGTIANANSVGRFVASRTGASALSIYRNGTSLGTVTGSLTSVAVASIEFFIGSINQSGSPVFRSSDQLSQASIGAGLSSVEQAAFDAAISTYLTAVGA